MSDAAHADDINTGTPPEIEAEARRMGWRPKDEWEGDDSNWMEADRFVERQNKLRGIADPRLKEENERLQREVRALKDEQAETRQTLDDFKGWRDKAEKTMYERALKDIQDRQRAAVESGDTDAFDAAAKDQADLMKEATAKPETKQTKQVNPDDVPAFKDWSKENKWYGRDYELTDYANRIAPMIARNESLGGDDPDYYARITEEVAKKYPEKFENPNRKRASGVESPSGGSGGKGGKKGAADLPAEAKAAGERFVKQKLYKSLDDYAKDYFAQEE